MSLDLDVKKEPLIGAIEPTDLDQFVDGAAAVVVIGSESLQFGVEEFGWMAPVDRIVDGREAKLEEGLEETLDGHLPGCVELIRS